MTATADRTVFRTGAATDAACPPLAQPASRPSAHPADGSTRSGDGVAAVNAALLALIENLEQGIAVTDRSARAHFLNRAAHDLIRRGPLRLWDGCLRGGTLGDSVALRRIIARCALGHAAGSLRLADADGSTLLVTACTIPSPGGPPAENAVLLRFIDPAEARLPGLSVLRDQFGFTPTEAALAGDLLAGVDLASSAARRRITLNTARVHLRRIFEKTGTHRQAELMRLLLLCPQAIAPYEADAKSRHAILEADTSNGGCGRAQRQ